MARIFKTPYNVKLPKSRHEEEEFGPGKKGLRICTKCGSYYYRKSWHHGAEKFILRKTRRDTPIRFLLCPACQMMQNGVFEGEVVIRGVPDQQRKGMAALIKNFCSRAFLRDPQDRLISYSEKSDTIIARVTENQLAVKLAKKISDAYRKKAEFHVKYSKEPADTARVYVDFI